MTHILLIEDNEEIRENMVETLEFAGYQVTAAVNGKNGLALALATSPNVILCDILMPEMDGYEVFSLLRSNKSTSRIPFIFVTATAEKKDIEAAIAMGVDGYLCKPFEPNDLFAIITQALDRSIIYG